MKTLHLSTEWHFRGGEQQVLLLVRGLQKLGHQADLICQPDSGLYERARESAVSPFPLRMRGEVDLLSAWSIARKIAREHYDVVHSHTPHALSLVFLALRMLRHHPVRLFTRRVEFSIFRHNFLGLNHYKYNRGTDHIVAISHRVKEQLLRDGVPANKISVVHSGVDVDRFRRCSGKGIRQEFGISSETPVLGSIGFLEENKGHVFLLQALKKLTKCIPEIRLFILGKGRMEKDLKNLTKDLRIEKNVVFTGFRTDVGAFLSILDLMVVASTEEGLNTSIMDALALNVPVVATAVGGIPEIVTHQETGFLVPPANPEILAEGMAWMLSNKDEAKKMAEKGAQRVHQEFSAAAMVQKNIAVYQKVLASQRSNTQ